VSNVVLEVIREQNPLYEVDKAMLDLTDRGWKLGKSPRESLSQEYVR